MQYLLQMKSIVPLLIQLELLLVYHYTLESAFSMINVLIKMFVNETLRHMANMCFSNSSCMLASMIVIKYMDIQFIWVD